MIFEQAGIALIPPVLHGPGLSECVRQLDPTLSH